MKAKLFRLDNVEEEDDYGADVKKGEGGQFEFITEIFGKNEQPVSSPNSLYHGSTVMGFNPLYHGLDDIPQQVSQVLLSSCFCCFSIFFAFLPCSSYSFF
jgi:hypothetical protein